MVCRKRQAINPFINKRTVFSTWAVARDWGMRKDDARKLELIQSCEFGEPIITVGMIGLGASVGYRNGASPPPEIATISENEPAKPQLEKTNRSDVPTPDASIPSAASQPSPGTVVNAVAQRVEPQPRETMPTAGIAASPEQIETQTEPSRRTAPIEPMTTALVERHDALMSNDMPPRAIAKLVPLPVPRPAAVAKASTPKTAARMAMPRSGVGGTLRRDQASTVTAQPMQATDTLIAWADDQSQRGEGRRQEIMSAKSEVWLTRQSAANRSAPSNSLLTGKRTGNFTKNWAVWRKIARKTAAKSVSCRTIPYKMKQGINSRRTGNF
jgi:hypothetical protein